MNFPASAQFWNQKCGTGHWTKIQPPARLYLSGNSGIGKLISYSFVLSLEFSSFGCRNKGPHFHFGCSVEGCSQLPETTTILGLWPSFSIFKANNSRLSPFHITFLLFHFLNTVWLDWAQLILCISNLNHTCKVSFVM